MATDPSPATAPFGVLLKRYRLVAGLTQEGLAERAGISARAVSDLDRTQIVRRGSIRWSFWPKPWDCRLWSAQVSLRLPILRQALP